jgi:hypothetical protein
MYHSGPRGRFIAFPTIDRANTKIPHGGIGLVKSENERIIRYTATPGGAVRLAWLDESRLAPGWLAFP